MLPLATFFVCLVFFSCVSCENMVGINYGREGGSLPSPFRSIEIIKSIKARGVKLYDADPETMKLLANTDLLVSIMLPNHRILEIASNQTSANNWVADSVLAYYPATMIRYILVGNEVLSFSSDQDRRIWGSVVPAMRMINSCLKSHSIRNIKIGTPLAMDVVEKTFPPSEGRFRSDVASTFMPQLLSFLNGTNSFFFVNVYPYFSWSQNTSVISLKSALSSSDRQIQFRDPGTDLTYTNLLDQMLDSLIFAMAKLGFFDVKLFISETGWPNRGDAGQPGANPYNAAAYNRNIIKRMTRHPPVGTPARSGVEIPTFLFSLFDEDKKAGPGTEKHWGLYDPTGLPHYDIDFSGNSAAEWFQPTPAPPVAPAQPAMRTLPGRPSDGNMRRVPYQRKVWCVAVEGADRRELARGLQFACSHGNGTCSAIMFGRECHRPVSLYRHASYAFSSYWAKHQPETKSCYFNGAARMTTRDPSIGLCRFPSVIL